MTSPTTQTFLAALLGIVIMTIVIRLARKKKLSFRYTIGWIAVASIGILAGLFVPLVEPVAGALGLSAAALLVITALLFYVAISIQLSISISGLQQQVRTLTEELARLRYTVTHQND